jgi:hypothetical protein
MLFRQDVLRGIGEGEVTLAFRRWRRATVKAGGTLRTRVGVLAIDSVEVIDEKRVTDADARTRRRGGPRGAARRAAGGRRAASDRVQARGARPAHRAARAPQGLARGAC